MPATNSNRNERSLRGFEQQAQQPWSPKNVSALGIEEEDSGLFTRKALQQSSGTERNSVSTVERVLANPHANRYKKTPGVLGTTAKQATSRQQKRK
jgi:hypothetical protein